MLAERSATRPPLEVGTCNILQNCSNSGWVSIWGLCAMAAALTNKQHGERGTGGVRVPADASRLHRD